MAKSLVIVESPAKAKTIEKYLGNDFMVKSSVGHIRDLPEKRFGIDLKKDFEMEFEIIKGKEKVISDLKKSARDVDNIYLAADPDREGEAICWHIKEILKGRKKKNIFRVLFYEITKSGVNNAFKNPGEINDDKVNAQMARRILDRIVGYEISPLISHRLRRRASKFLSAGRVQSVALKLIVDREEEILNFKPEEYWSVAADFKTRDEKNILTKLHSINKKTIDNKKFKISSSDEIEKIVAEVKDANFQVSDIKKKPVSRKPAAPFITSKLQQEAFVKFGFSAKKTMMLAQNLYEGVDLDSEGRTGLITYMRTDSTRISKDAENQAREYITENYGEQYIPKKPRIFKVGKAAQEAHEAIRPTSVERRPENVKKYLTLDQFKLYDLIWRRFLASQMSNAKFDQTTIDISDGEKYIFRATQSKPSFKGFLAVYEEVYVESLDKKASSNGEVELPELKKNETLKLAKITPKQHFTEPPPRYSEGSLVKALDEKGIGRPSTYATILGKIMSREYVNVEKKRFRPSELGIIVTKMLVTSFPKLMNEKFTAEMENELDQIELGKLEWKDTMNDFYSKFEERLETAKKDMRIPVEETDIPCDKCDAMMVIKWGKNKRFLSCSRYPDCSNAKNFEIDRDTGKIHILEDRETDIECDKCGAKMVIKTGRDKKFLSCSNYPDCKNAQNFIIDSETGDIVIQKDEKTDIDCDKCGAKMIIKIGRNNKFLSCSNYPDCKNAKNFSVDDKTGKIKILKDQETEIKCEKCGNKMVVKKGRYGDFLACSGYPKCRNTKKMDSPISGADTEKTEKKKCPECGKDMELKWGRYGQYFACTGYPDCKTIVSLKGKATKKSPEEPKVTDIECEKCGKKMVIKKGRYGDFLACSGFPKCKNTKKMKDLEK